jgi:two-component system, LuxR family, sensor kinase FixL
LSYVTMLWSMVAAAALVLGSMQALVWSKDRQARAGLVFAVLAFSLAAVAFTELRMMHAQSPEEWGRWVRWCHVPLFCLIVSAFLFVRLYLNAGRWWLIGVIVAVRVAILVANFATDPNFNFARIDAIDRVSFLGETISIVGDHAPGTAQWIATSCVLLYLVFMFDASATLWRRGTKSDRRKTVLIGGGMLAFIALSVANTQLVIWGVIRQPMMIAPAFLIPLLAMAFELSRDSIRAAGLARDLSESERRLDLAASSAGLGLCAWHGNGEAWATPRARELIGLRPDDRIDIDRLAAIVHRDDVPGMRAALEQSLRAGGDCSGEFRIVLPDGTERWILARGCSAPAARGKGRTLRGVLRDVTEQKKAEAEAEELRRELTHIGRVTALGQLTTSLAHELSQPLGAILRNAEAAELLLDRRPTDLVELRAILADIHRDDRRAGEVIDRLRALLQRRPLRFERIAVGGLIRDVSALVRPDAAARHILLRCDLDANLPCVSGDRVHLSQVLLNLLINAFDAISETRRARQVVVEARGQGQHEVKVEVTDWGTGIPADRLRQIFEPFYTTKAAGMGMGLSVSRTIVEAHGGRIWAENANDAGARFHLVLPVDQGVAA